MLPLDLGDPVASAAILRAIDQRVEAALERRLPIRGYGTVASVAAGSAALYIRGQATSSPGFVYPARMKPAVGELVRYVIDGGDRYIEESLGAPATAGSLIVAGRLRAGGDNAIGVEQARNSVEAWLGSKSLITLGEGADGDGNPAMTLHRTASGFESGGALRLFMPSSAGGLKVQASSGADTAYGSMAFSDLFEFSRNLGEIILGGVAIRVHTISLGVAATAFVDANATPAAGMGLFYSLGNNGASLIQYYRLGSFNEITGITTQTGIWQFMVNTYAAGAGGLSVFMESNGNGARIGVKNNMGFSTTLRLVTFG